MLDSSPRQRKCKYSCDRGFFAPQALSPVSCYWLGFLAADGYIHPNLRRFAINLKAGDESHLRLFLEDLQSDYPVSYYIAGQTATKQHRACRVQITAPQICQDLNQLGVTPQKTQSLQVQIDKLPYPRDFVRGFFDGDGCFSLSNGKPIMTIAGASQPFLLHLQAFLAEEVGLNILPLTLFSPEFYALSYSGRLQVEAIMRYLYKQSPRHLERKYQKACQHYGYDLSS